MFDDFGVLTPAGRVSVKTKNSKNRIVMQPDIAADSQRVLFQEDTKLLQKSLEEYLIWRQRDC